MRRLFRESCAKCYVTKSTRVVFSQPIAFKICYFNYCLHFCGWCFCRRIVPPCIYDLWFNCTKSISNNAYIQTKYAMRSSRLTLSRSLSHLHA